MVRFATHDDIESIMNFIDDYWKENHILARDRDFFEYEMCSGKATNFVIAVNDETGAIDALEGYIPYGSTVKDMGFVIWKANKTEDPMLGVNVLKYLIDNGGGRVCLVPGMNRKVAPLYKLVGFETGKMNHWYRLAANNEEFKIANVLDRSRPAFSGKQKELIRLERFEDVIRYFDFAAYYHSEMKPIKESWYVEKRYFKNPYYQYQVYGVSKEDDSSVGTLLVCRKQNLDNASALRFVDLIGNVDDAYSVTEALDKLMTVEGVEYIDFYEHGMNQARMIEAGWIQVGTNENIIPNYFAPFCQENIDIYYAVNDGQAFIFKGDGDQDRPN